MSRQHRSLSSFVLLATVTLVGCEVHTTWGTGGTTSNEEAHEEAPAAKKKQDVNHHFEAPPADDLSAEADNAARASRRRRAAEESARIDREAKERVAQAEHDAAEREREAEADAERQRQQAAADAEQRQREAAEAAAKSDKAQNAMHRRQPTGRFDMGTQGASDAPKDEVLLRRNNEINQSTEEKKAAIRKQLEQNKSDILVAAERKRTEVQESLKDQPEKKP